MFCNSIKIGKGAESKKMIKDGRKSMTYKTWDKAWDIVKQENNDVKNEKESIVGDDMSRKKYDEIIEKLYRNRALEPNFCPHCIVMCGSHCC